MAVIGTPGCGSCGARIAPGAHFCGSCGADVSGQQGDIATAHTPPSAAVRPGDREALLHALRDATLGEYEVLGELGRGGMASVYVAHDIALDRRVAIKVMSPTLFEGEAMVERFKREARTAASLSHPHIIPIYAVRESEHLVFFVMKLIEGRPLDSIIKELGPLPIPMVQAILQQVGGALGYAHRRNVVHRDVKPANIMIDVDGWPVVADFGIAKVAEKQGLTITGATIGTPSYMSPEQCAAKEVTGASDQYSLGVVAYEMLTGRLPFRAESIVQLMYAHFHEVPAPVATVRRDCPLELGTAVMRMLEKEQERRFSDIESAVGAMGAAPLAHDDPIRTQLMTLAASGPQSRMLRGLRAPTSPVPQSRPRGARVPGVTTSGVGWAIVPGHVAVAVDGAVQLTAKAATGATLVGRRISWASTNPAVATVSASGLVTAVGTGTVLITASSETESATATIAVTAGDAARGRSVRWVAGGLVAAAAAALVWLQPWRAGAVSNGGGQTLGASAESIVGVAPPRIAADTGPRPAASPAAPIAPTDSAAVTPTRVPPPTAPPRASERPPRRDSVVRDIRERTRALRERAVAAGATAADLAAGDAAARQAEALAARGQLPAARSRQLQAQTLWSQAERAALARATAPVGRLRPDSAPVRPADTAAARPPAEPARTAPDPQVVAAQVIGEYARALESKDMARVRRIFPGLPPERERTLRDFFQVAQGLTVRLQVTDAVRAGEGTDAGVSGEFSYRNRDDRRDYRQPVSFRATIQPGPAGWFIATMR